jgi:hypothetical protein
LTKNEDLEEKRVLGSGGYAFVYLTEDEELKFNLGLPHLFFGNIGRLDKKDSQNITVIIVEKNIQALL